MKSKGIKRNLASLLAALAAASAMIPALAPFQQYIIWAAGLLGGTGLLHAAADNNLTIK